ncbi:MAG: class I SAM-dependent methyltransferase [Thiotrichales bacterium]
MNREGPPNTLALVARRLDDAVAQSLARRLGIPLHTELTAQAALWLHQTDSGLELRLTHPGAPGAIRVDFLSGKVRGREQQPELLTKAIGLPRLKRPRVIDATAGLGRDAWVLASRGCDVTLLERSAIVHALLEDGLDRARRDPSASQIAACMTLHQVDAIDYLGDPEHGADVVYLDPMFPERRKSAQVKKEMQVLQALLGHDVDLAQLLDAARAAAHYRVVVKRPLHGERLPGGDPTFVLAGRSTRFDIYVNRGLP